MPIRRTLNRKGFTLIEALFATFLVAICAAVVAATTPVASMSQIKGQNLNRATGIAQKQLEAIRGAGFPNINGSQLANIGLLDSSSQIATNTYSFTNADTAKFDSPAKVLPNGTGSVLIEQLDMNTVRVTVTITWKERGTTRSFVAGTIVANI